MPGKAKKPATKPSPSPASTATSKSRRVKKSPAGPPRQTPVSATQSFAFDDMSDDDSSAINRTPFGRGGDSVDGQSRGGSMAKSEVSRAAAVFGEGDLGVR